MYNFKSDEVIYYFIRNEAHWPEGTTATDLRNVAGGHYATREAAEADREASQLVFSKDEKPIILWAVSIKAEYKWKKT